MEIKSDQTEISSVTQYLFIQINMCIISLYISSNVIFFFKYDTFISFTFTSSGFNSLQLRNKPVLMSQGHITCR